MQYYKSDIQEYSKHQILLQNCSIWREKNLSDFMIGKSKGNSSVLPIREWGKLTAIYSFFIKFLLTFKNFTSGLNCPELFIIIILKMQVSLQNDQKAKQTSAASIKRGTSIHSPQHSEEIWFYFKMQTKQKSSAKKIGRSWNEACNHHLMRSSNCLAKHHSNFTPDIKIFWWILDFIVKAQ